MAGHQGRPPRPDRGADRLGQDARRLPRRDRRARAPRRWRASCRTRPQSSTSRRSRRCRTTSSATCEAPLAGIRAALSDAGPARRRDPHLGAHRRHAARRARAHAPAARRTSSSPRRSRSTSCSARESGRAMLATTRTVIVDEIHALAPNKRGAHLALSLERLDALCGDRRLLRIGLSATQKPIEEVARFLVGPAADGPAADCTHRRYRPRARRDLAIEVPHSPLEAVMSAEVWRRSTSGWPQLIDEHRTTLIFVNTRRMAERVARASVASGSARSMSPRTTAASPRAAAGRRAAAQARRAQGAGGDRFARARHRHRRRRSRVPDRLAALDRDASCSAWAARAMPSAARPKGACSRCRATSWWSARRCSTRRAAASSIALVIPSSRSTCSRSRSSPRLPRASGRRTRSMPASAARGPTARSPREDFDAVVDDAGGGFTTRRGRRGALIHHDAVNRRAARSPRRAD